MNKRIQAFDQEDKVHMDIPGHCCDKVNLKKSLPQPIQEFCNAVQDSITNRTLYKKCDNIEKKEIKGDFSILEKLKIMMDTDHAKYFGVLENDKKRLLCSISRFQLLDTLDTPIINPKNINTAPGSGKQRTVHKKFNYNKKFSNNENYLPIVQTDEMKTKNCSKLLKLHLENKIYGKPSVRRIHVLDSNDLVIVQPEKVSGSGCNKINSASFNSTSKNFKHFNENYCNKLRALKNPLDSSKEFSCAFFSPGSNFNRVDSVKKKLAELLHPNPNNDGNFFAGHKEPTLESDNLELNQPAIINEKNSIKDFQVNTTQTQNITENLNQTDIYDKSDLEKSNTEAEEIKDRDKEENEGTLSIFSESQFPYSEDEGYFEIDGFEVVNLDKLAPFTAIFSQLKSLKDSEESVMKKVKDFNSSECKIKENQKINIVKTASDLEFQNILKLNSSSSESKNNDEIYHSHLLDKKPNDSKTCGRLSKMANALKNYQEKKKIEVVENKVQKSYNENPIKSKKFEIKCYGRSYLNKQLCRSLDCNILGE